MQAVRDEMATAQPREESSFWSEMTAGIAGYARSAIVGDAPADHEFDDPVRAQFQRDLASCDIPATLVRQLQNQNYVQDRFGNGLPAEAAQAMLEQAMALKSALDTGDRVASARAHRDYMMDTIPAFTENGSSSAPAWLHRLGVAWQTPGVALAPGHLLGQPQSLTERISSWFGGESQSSPSADLATRCQAGPKEDAEG